MSHYSWVASLIPRRGAVGGAGRAAARLGLDVTPSDFLATAATVGVAVSPSTQIVPQGLTAFFPVRLTRNGVPGVVTLSVASGLPAGAAADPVAIPAGADTGTLVVRLPGAPAAGDYPFTVAATSDLGTVGTAAATLTVATTAPAAIGLTLAQAAYTVSAGASVDVLVTLARTNYTSAVSLAVSGLPTGVTGSFSPSSLTGGTLASTLTLSATGGAPTADATFTVTASGAGVTNAVATATLHVDATPSTRPQIAFKAMRHDGLTGNARAVGFVQFQPGAITAADIPNATAWDANGARVGIYIEDIGARHLSNNVANELLGAHVQLDTTFATPGSEPTYTLKFDQPVTAADRITAQDYTEWTQALPVSIGTDTTKLGIGACTAHPYDGDAPIRIAAQDAVWAKNQAVTIPGTGFGVVVVRFMVRTATGQVVAYPKALASAASATSTTTAQLNQHWLHTYGGSENVVGETCIGFATIYVAAGTAATTVGTSALNGAGITVTTTGSGKEPFSTLPTEMPVASLAPSDATYLSACEFPGHTLTPKASDPDALLVSVRPKGSDWTWGRLGWYTYLTNGGSTWYNSGLSEWLLYARGYGSRFYRRALATQKAFRYLAQVTTGGYGSLPEAGADAAQPLVYYALTQRPSDALNVAAAVEVAAARLVLKRNESAEYNGHTTARNAMYGTGRFGMHVLQACPWFARLGVGIGTAYKVIPANDGELWPNAAQWQTVTTAADCFARMCDRMHTSVVAAAASPGLRYLAQPNGDDFLCFMQGWTWSYLALGLRCFGTPVQYPGGPLSDATDGIVKDMNDSVEFAFGGRSKWTNEPLYVTRGNGGTSFVYCMPGGMIVDGGEITTRSTLAVAMTAYNDATLTLANAAPFPAAGGRIRLASTTAGTPAAVYDYTSRSGNVLSGVTYVAGPQTAWGVGAAVQGHVNGPNSSYVGTNGTWLMALAHQYQTLTGAAKTTAKARGDALRLGQHDTTPPPAGQADTRLSTWFWPKELPEVDLVGSCWDSESA